MLRTTQRPNAVRGRRRLLVPTDVSAWLEEGMMKLKAIEPTHGAGPETIHYPRGGRHDSERRSQSPDTARVGPRLR
jgi:hypothetical protein